MMNQEPYPSNFMPDTFVNLGETSYGASIEDYQAQMGEFDLKGPNAQYLPPAGFEGEGEGGEPEDDCCDELAAANSTINCLADKLLPKELNGSLSWSYSATSTRPDFGPPYSPTNPEPCTKTITSNIQVEFVSGIKLKFCREDNRIPEDCGATGSIGWNISLNKDGSNGIPITWSDTPNGQQSCATRNSTLNTTYYIFAAGLNLNENGPPQAYRYMGSFFVSSAGEITRTVNTVNEFIEGDPLPCGLVPEPEPKEE